jgi:hypothetical protein
MSSELSIRKVVKSDELILASIIRSTFEEFDAPRTGTVYNSCENDFLAWVCFKLVETTKK